MNILKQNLYITYSNQKARDLKRQSFVKPLDKVITLENLILEIFESKNFEIVIDEIIASSIIYKIIQSNKIEYFSYLNDDAVSLNTIYNFIIKCKRNSVAFDTLLECQKLDAIVEIDKGYQEYKRVNNLVDIADVEQSVLKNWDADFGSEYSEIYVDSFEVGGINFIKSKTQKQILDKLSQYKTIQTIKTNQTNPKVIKPSNEVFDNIDEIKTALRITRKLLEEGVSSDEILIVASDIQEYAPLYKLFLDEYELKGYSSIGTPLSSFHNTSEPKVKAALDSYRTQVQSLTALYKKLNLALSETTKENVKNSITILDEKIGVEITEPNQLVGLNKRYEHIIFIGTDINHFPPKTSDNFLYSYDDALKYFYENNYFTSSQTQFSELKRLTDNLYIITASYNGKRELSRSIVIDNNFDDTIDISNIKSVPQLALENSTKLPDEQTKKYYESISSQNFTAYDGNGVKGIKATHLSASQINKYLSCPLSFLYANKIKIQAPSQDEEGFDVMEQGSLMHLCYELFGRRIKENKITSVDQKELYNLMLEVSIEAYHHDKTRKPRYKEELQENIHHQIFLSTLQAGLNDDKKKGLLAKFVDYYIENASEFNYFRNTEFEKEFALDSELKPYKLKDKEDKNYFIKGFIDRFDNLEENINIIDYKSKKIKSIIDKEKMEQIAEQKDIQLALYILFASQEYQDKKYHSSLLSFKGDRPYSHFANLSNEQGLKNAVHYSDKYHEDLKRLIFDTRDKIEAGKFAFNNSDEKMCGWCDIKHICHESVLSKNI